MASANSQAAETRRKVLGSAVRTLRELLKMNQPEFAQLFGGRTNFLYVSKWERAKIAPNKWRCERLAEIATGAGRPDIAEAFRLPPEEWRSPLDDKRLNRTLTLLQIGAATLRASETGDYPFPSDEYIHIRLQDAAAAIEAHLLKRYKHTKLTPKLSDGEQFRLWFDMLAEFEKMDRYYRERGEPGYLESAEDKFLFGWQVSKDEKANSDGERRETRKEAQ